MLLSNTHKFIFIHVAKTGGTTVNSVFSRYCVDNNKDLYRRLLSNLPIRENPEKMYLRPHASALWARIKLGSELFKNYYKFAFIRNPFDLLVSRYEFIKQSSHKYSNVVRNMSFSEFLDMEFKRNFFSRKDQYSKISDINGNIIVNDLYKFEEFNDSICTIADKLGLENIKIVNANKTFRKEYKTYYADSDINKVYKFCERDISVFDYEY